MLLKDDKPNDKIKIDNKIYDETYETILKEQIL